MKKVGFFFIAGMIVVSAVLIAGLDGTPVSGSSPAPPGPSDQTLLAGRNVNMVSGSKLPFGDPWLQRQNEPSIATSTRNPQHLLAGANDYRTIDIPDDFKLPGIEGTASADAWLGVYESFNGGESWITTLLPGFPQDASSEGQNSPLFGYETACDPIVRAGANGLFYYCGIAFNRTTNESAIFVARYVDNNNLEKVEKRTDPYGKPKYSGPIQYIDTRLVATGSTSSNFIDMPNMAVDVPRLGARYGNVYVAYTVFSNTGGSSTADKVFFQRSTDGGVTWSAPPVQLSTTGEIVQRPVIAVDPIDLRGNTVYVAFRRFAKGNVPDGIVVVKSTNGGKTFSKLPDVAPFFYPFDQGTSFASFRTNSYPTMVVGDLGTVYVAWSQRMGGPSGQARIMISALKKGRLVWTSPKVVDQTYAGLGHQFMPSLSFAAWKLMLAWYDQREDLALDESQSIADSQGAVPRHTIDVRAAEGRPGLPPKFSPSIQLSRYLHVLDLDSSGNPKEEGGYYKVIQAEYNPINYPLFQLGTVPFHGDYLEVTPSVRILPPAIAFGYWIYNINPLEPTSFHTAWTDNRDVRPPNGDSWGDWVNYNAPGSIQDDWPYPQPPACSDGSKTGMRNQNIYTANINKGLIMGSPGNTKQLDLPLTGDGGRTFVVFVKNTTEFERTLNLVIIQIGRVNASFDQFKNEDHIQVHIPPYSSVSHTVYVDRSTRRLAPVTVNAFEGFRLVGYVVLNPDPTNLPLGDPDNPFNDLGKETHDPDVSAPQVWNYDLGDENDPNASAVLAPRVQNPRVQNYSVVNPRVQNEGVLNPRVQNESIVNNEVPNPRVQNTVVPNGALTDVTWTVTNEGNTTSVFTTNIQSEYPDYFNGENPPLIAQVLVYRVHRVPVDKDCQLYETHQDELIANISNPRVQNPRVQNSPPSEGAGSTRESPISIQAANLEDQDATFHSGPGEQADVTFRVRDEDTMEDSSGPIQAANPADQDITFYLAPGEQAEVTFRVWDEDTTDGLPTFSPDMVIAEAVAEAVNTEVVEGGGTTPPSDVPPNSEPWDNHSPGIGVSSPSLSFGAMAGIDPADQLLTVLNSGEGTLNYTVVDDAAWLFVTPASGTPTPQDHTVSIDVAGLTAGVYTGTITISDPSAVNNPVKVPVTLTLTAVPALSITTTSIPDGIRDTPYSVSLYCSGGVGDATWTVFTGSLPPGLDLATTEGGSGWITGTPTAAGSFSFIVQAEDELHQTVTQPLSITVADYWVARYNNSAVNGIDQAWWPYTARSAPITTDAAGNIYVAGDSMGSGTSSDYATVKYNSSGVQQWVARYDGLINGADKPEAIAVDALGNVYVTGQSSLQAYDYDFATVKYDSAGVQQWIATYNGPANGYDRAHAMTVDASGNVYVTGDSNGSGTSSDFATVKYNSDGVQQWIARYNGPGNAVDTACSIALDPAGNVYVTGYSTGSGTDYDYATVKYDSSGEQQWVQRFNGPISGQDWPCAIALDSSGNVYVTGFSVGTGTGSDYATIKYDGSGVQQWVRRYDDHGDGDDWASAMAIDSAGNIYVTGQSAGSYITGFDCATVKYSSAGVEQWAARYSGPVTGEDKSFAIAVDPLQNVYISGYSMGSETGFDYITVKSNSSGAQEWAARYDGPANGSDQGLGVVQDLLGSVLVTGGSMGSGTDLDFATIKYALTFPSTLIISTDLLDNGYTDVPYAKAVWAFGGSGTRQWQLAETDILPPGLVLNSSTGIVSGTPTTPGTYNFSVQLVDDLLVTSKSLSITIATGTALPDLVVESLTHSPANPTTADTVTITAVVKNQGTTSAGASTLQIPLTGQATTQYSIGTLAAGATQTVTRTVEPLSAGTYTLNAWADCNAVVAESSETNNVTVDYFTVGGLPDLIISGVGTQPPYFYPPFPKPTDTLTLVVTVLNQGAGSAGASTARLFVGGATFDLAISALAAGASQVINYPIGTLDAGTYSTTATADIYNAVVESNEANNQIAPFNLIVGQADLVVASLTHSPANPTITTPVTVTVVIQNIGNVTAEASTMSLYVSGWATQNYSIPQLAAGASYSVPASVGLLSAATHVATATADVNNVVEESNEGNNVSSDSFLVSAAPLPADHRTAPLLDVDIETETVSAVIGPSGAKTVSRLPSDISLLSRIPAHRELKGGDRRWQ